MRAAIVVTVAVMLAVGSTMAIAQTYQAQPAPVHALPAGEPAGLKPAQRASNAAPLVLGIGVVAAGIGLVAANDNDDSNPVVPTTTAP